MKRIPFECNYSNALRCHLHFLYFFIERIIHKMCGRKMWLNVSSVLIVVYIRLILWLAHNLLLFTFSLSLLVARLGGDGIICGFHSHCEEKKNCCHAIAALTSEFPQLFSLCNARLSKLIPPPSTQRSKLWLKRPEIGNLMYYWLLVPHNRAARDWGAFCWV